MAIEDKSKLIMHQLGVFLETQDSYIAISMG